MLHHSTLLMVIVSLFLSTASWAKMTDPEAEKLKRIIRTGEPAEVDAAVQTIRDTFEKSDDDAYMCIQFLRVYWREALESRERHAEIAEFAWRGVLARPHDTKQLDALLRIRIEALQREDRHAEALTDAVRLFNIVPVNEAGDAILLISEQLVASRPNDPDIGERFRQQQNRGVQEPGAKSPLVLSVDLRSAELEQVLERVSSPDDFRNKVGPGNVLLLLGRGEAARAYFEKNTGDKKLADGVGRSLKAVDGTIGRANGWAAENLTADPTGDRARDGGR